MVMVEESNWAAGIVFCGTKSKRWRTWRMIYRHHNRSNIWKITPTKFIYCNYLGGLLDQKLIKVYSRAISNWGSVSRHSRWIRSSWALLRTEILHGNGSRCEGKKKLVLPSTLNLPSYH